MKHHGGRAKYLFNFQFDTDGKLTIGVVRHIIFYVKLDLSIPLKVHVFITGCPFGILNYTSADVDQNLEVSFSFPYKHM